MDPSTVVKFNFKFPEAFSEIGISPTLIEQAKNHPKSLIKQFPELTIVNDENKPERKSEVRKIKIVLISVMLKTRKSKHLYLIIDKINRLGFNKKDVSFVATLILTNFEELTSLLVQKKKEILELVNDVESEKLALLFATENQRFLKLVKCIKSKEEWDKIYKTLKIPSKLLFGAAIANTFQHHCDYWRTLFNNDLEIDEEFKIKFNRKVIHNRMLIQCEKKGL